MFIPTAGRGIKLRAMHRVGLTIAGLGCAVALAACTPSAANSAGTAPSSTSPAVAPPSAAPSPTTPAPTMPAPRPSATPSGTRSTTTGTTAVRQTPSCASRNFTAVPVAEEGAAGSAYFTVTITNHGATCLLPGRPILRYTRSSGQVATIPFVATNAGSKPRSVLVRHGRSVAMTFRTPDGYGGWSPGSPQCAHPVTYHGISVAIGAGRVALANFALDVKCEGVTLWSYWSATS